MPNSRIDGKGLLPYSCKHGNGYNSTQLCFQCAIDRCNELERIIYVQGEALKKISKFCGDKPIGNGHIKLVTDVALKTARQYFNDRPCFALFTPDWGYWLKD